MYIVKELSEIMRRPEINIYIYNELGFLKLKYFNCILNGLGMRNTPAWAEKFHTTRMRSMIVFNSTGYKISCCSFCLNCEL